MKFITSFLQDQITSLAMAFLLGGIGFMAVGLWAIVALCATSIVAAMVFQSSRKKQKKVKEAIAYGKQVERENRREIRRRQRTPLEN